MVFSTPIVPPGKPWRYNKEHYKRRNGVERLFRRIKRFRRLCTRYEKLTVMYLAFVNLPLICDELKLSQHTIVKTIDFFGK
jgi:transposase